MRKMESIFTLFSSYIMTHLSYIVLNKKLILVMVHKSFYIVFNKDIGKNFPKGNCLKIKHFRFERTPCEHLKGNQKTAKWSNGSKYSKLKTH